MKTTIQIDTETLERLKQVKNNERESYNFVINRILNEFEKESLSDEEIEEIKIGLESIKQGKTISFDKLVKEMRIQL